MKPSPESLRGAVEDAYPELALVREAADEDPVYVVGGAVRDLLLGRERSDLDLVVLGDATGLASRLRGEAVHHERFATATVSIGEHQLDIATARTESYPRPGSLPEVEPATEIEADLRRRDFSINAMAVSVTGAPELLDPYGGLEDLREGILRVLHDRSIADDPTRAIRAARYAARFGFRPEPATLAQIESADLGTVSSDRRRSELLRLAREPSAVAALELLVEWGALQPADGGLELARTLQELLSVAPWAGYAPRDETLLAAALGPRLDLAELRGPEPSAPSEGVARAAGRSPLELAIARASGARWLDSYLAEWSRVRLEIGGEDLIAAGVPEGPAIGRGLEAALRRKLDGEIDGRRAELEAALAAAGDDEAG